MLWVGNLGRFTWAVLAGGLPGGLWVGLTSSEDLTGLDVQEDTLTWLTVDNWLSSGSPTWDCQPDLLQVPVQPRGD